MVEPAILTSLGWLVSPLTKMLLDKGLKHLGDNIDRDMDILRSSALLRISLAIEAAEKSPNKDRLELWLERLKNAYYEAEEAIDLFEYELLERKVKDERTAFRRKIKNPRKTVVSFPLHQHFKFSSRKLGDYMSVFSQEKVMLRGCIDKIINIANEASRDFHDLLMIKGDLVEQDRENIAVPPKSVFGREKDKEEIVKKLMKKPGVCEPGPSILPDIPVIAITGPPGVGKTTLAQYVYDHMENQKYFDISIWVHIPRKFRADDVIEKMLSIIKIERSTFSAAQGGKPEQMFLFENQQSSSNSSTLEALRRQLNNKLGGQKLLLVLDDLWCDKDMDVEQWEKLMCCLNNCSCLQGSKILLTTQSLLTARKIDVAEENIYELKQLEEDQFFQLFMHHALPRSRPIEEDEFGEIGRKIALKLKGDPSAAKIVGTQMKDKHDIKQWREISEKDWLGDNMKARIWSYQQLPAELQRCFTFCSLFPKGCILYPFTLVQLWMAEGFIKPVSSDKMEDIGHNYLDELVAKYFLEKHEDKQGKYYVLHDLLHDLAERVVGDDCIRIESVDNYEEIPERIKRILFQGRGIRRLSLTASMMNKLQGEICKQKKLRTLIMMGDGTFIPRDQLRKILHKLKKLRILLLPMCKIEYLPDCIGNLKHLRYLSIPDCALEELPSSICQLYHLQLLALLRCKSLPKKFSEVISLRQFATDGETQSKISDVGRLINLQHLTEFHVRDGEGHELQQLKDLDDLHGKLYIKGLENVTGKEDAIQAKLRQKANLSALELSWNRDERTSDDAEILEALQPHPNVRKICIRQFHGKSLPNWLVSQDLGRHLEDLYLCNCFGIEELSSIEQCLPNCKSLSLRGLRNLKEFPRLPANLDVVIIELPVFLDFVCTDELQMKEEIMGSIMQVAEHLAARILAAPEDVLNFHNIKTRVLSFFIELRGIDLPREDVLIMFLHMMKLQLQMMFNTDVEARVILPSSLTHLTLAQGNITNQALSMCIQNLELLTELTLCDMITITSLPCDQALHKLKKLQCLTIVRCCLLSSLGGIHAMTSLRKLDICGCPVLNTSDASLLPPSLRKVKISLCADVFVLIEKSNLPNLATLKILNSLIEKAYLTHLSSLKHLEIVECPKLLSLEGLSSLSKLEHKAFFCCPSLVLSDTPLIQEVSVEDPLTLELALSKQVMSKLATLKIINFEGDYIADNVLQPFTSLVALSFIHCQITSLPNTLKDLGSLQHLCIINCQNLGKLTDLPESLSCLTIEGCPNLKKRCQRNGSDWHKIAHIPDIIITW